MNYQEEIEFCIPDEITKIPTDYFCNTKLEVLTNYEHISKIGKCSFENANLKEFRVPNGTTEIPDWCFSYCKLEIITNYDHITKIGQYAFRGTNLKEFRVPNGVNEIPFGCFLNSKLEKIIIPRSIKNISNNAIPPKCLITWI